MIAIEAYRAAIGRFSKKAKSYSLCSALKKNRGIDVMLFMFLVTLWLTTLYGLVLTAMFEYYHYLLFLIVLTIMYSYSMWILKNTSDMLCTTLENMTKRNDLMRAPSPSKGIKDSPLTPCNYLDTFVIDGRFEYLDTYVLDDGYWSGPTVKIDYTKLMIEFATCLQVSLSYTSNIIICSSCMYIGIDIMSRINNAYSGLHYLESYSVSFLKLSQLLLAGDVESNPGPVNYTETPKGKGRPKKSSRASNFGKPKVLDFTSVVSDNRFLKQANLIHLSNWIVSEIYYH